MTGIKTLPVHPEGGGGAGLAGEALMEMSFAWASKMVGASFEAWLMVVQRCMRCKEVQGGSLGRSLGCPFAWACELVCAQH